LDRCCNCMVFEWYEGQETRRYRPLSTEDNAYRGQHACDIFVVRNNVREVREKPGVTIHLSFRNITASVSVRVLVQLQWLQTLGYDQLMKGG
jgi:hypothetical protein